MSYNFVKIHIDPYKSRQDSYRSTPIPTDQLRFEQINTYSFTLQHINKDTLILTQNHATSYRSTEIRSDTLRSVPIYKESHIIKQIHIDMLRLTQSCYFVQIHTEPYISTQIRTDPHGFGNNSRRLLTVWIHGQQVEDLRDSADLSACEFECVRD